MKKARKNIDWLFSTIFVDNGQIASNCTFIIISDLTMKNYFMMPLPYDYASSCVNTKVQLLQTGKDTEILTLFFSDRMRIHFYMYNYESIYIINMFIFLMFSHNFLKLGIVFVQIYFLFEHPFPKSKSPSQAKCKKMKNS